MAGTEVYRWCLDPDLKRHLEAEVRAEKTSVAAILDCVVRNWLAKREAGNEAEQRTPHAEIRRPAHGLCRCDLLRLVEREGLTTILAVDRAFEVYRIGGRKAFRVLPKR